MIVIPQVTPFHFGDEILNAGDTVSLTCTVGKGDLPLKIHWQLNDIDLSTGNGVVINRNGKRISVLSIENVQHEHIGNYTCIAENDAGISSHSAVLNVNGIKNYNCHEINFYFIRTVFEYFVFIFTYSNVVLPPHVAMGITCQSWFLRKNIEQFHSLAGYNRVCGKEQTSEFRSF